MLSTKCILHRPEPSDGKRISVMSRHTLNDGKTPHPDIRDGSYDEWLVELAPPAKLVGDYYRRGLDWKIFEERYIDYLRGKVEKAVRILASRALLENLTLLCIEEAPEKCHRRLIAEECVRCEPGIVTQIK
jgi:uncharacterized protein YeaO (DUF488 family)